jgi:hypothetical protein
VPAAATDLWDACNELLAAAQAALATTPGGAIPRAFVSPGPPAWDCPPQLTVHAGGPMLADTLPLSPTLQPLHRIGGPGTVNLVALTITALRCAPTLTDTVDLPSVNDLNAASKLTCADAWALWNHLKTAKKNKTLFVDDRGSAEREFTIDPAIALNIQGGVAGWQIQVRVELPGYVAP